MSVVPDTTVVANVGDFYTFTRGYAVTGYTSVAVLEADQSFTYFTANGYAFDIVGSQVIAVNRGALYPFTHGTVQYEILRTGSFKQISIYPIGTGTPSNLAQKFDPAVGVVVAGPSRSASPSTSLSSWNQQGLTFIPPANAAFASPWVGIANLLFNGDFAGSNPYKTGFEVAGWNPGVNVSNINRSGSGSPWELDVTPTALSSDSNAYSDPFPVTGSTGYYAQGSLLAPWSTAQGQIYVNFYSDAAGTAFISQVSAAPTGTVGTWCPWSLAFTTPSSAVSARIDAHNTSNTIPGDWYLANMFVTPTVSAFNLYVDALNIQAVNAATVLSASTAALAPWTPPRALQVNVTSDPHTSYQDLTYRMSIMNRILRQSVPMGMRVLQPTFSS